MSITIFCNSLNKKPTNIINLSTKTLDNYTLDTTIFYEAFEFKTDKTFSQYEFWIESYKDGEFIEKIPILAAFADEQDNYGFDFKLNTIINIENDIISYDFYSDNKLGVISSYTNDIKAEIPNHASYGAMYIRNPTKIEADKEITVLYLYIITNNYYSYTHVHFFDTNPELIKSYDSIFILKCKFN